MNAYEVLKRPVITEKNTMLQGQNKYIFEVDKAANKAQVKEAVEQVFKVNVKAVNIISAPGKRRRVKRRQVVAPGRKKAVVTVQQGQRIELFEGV